MNLEKVVKRRTLRDRYAANSRLISAMRFEVGYILVNIALLAALGIYVVASTPDMSPTNFLDHVILPYWLFLIPFPAALALAFLFYYLLKVAQNKDLRWLSATVSLIVALRGTLVVGVTLATLTLFTMALINTETPIDFSPLADFNRNATTLLNVEPIGFHALVTLACVDLFALFLLFYVQSIRGWVSFTKAFRGIPGSSLYVYDTTVITYDPKDTDQLQFVAGMLSSTGNYQNEYEVKEAALDPDALIRVALRSDSIVGATIHAPKSRKLLSVKSIRSGSDLNFDILLEDSFYLQSERNSTPEGKVAYDQVLERSATRGGWIATRSDEELILHWASPMGS